ncbi:hypothetical protein BOTBODRAFT_239964 [Botryobasidium botryosum FD-172 SS1]|uniref:Uncharacterized protein n=1 Tax=Botryobasidium botryosum (strain FD-172 SS1) TaxID=930990 RepID=A0A067MPY7_BOTB1|nr:hypothetical protein BOTBODRAFT_239964 [Botryobasidium botryosum FD-172 SS1]
MIGRSKSSCYSFDRVFKAYRTSFPARPQFRTRGTHNKIYAKWAKPNLSNLAQDLQSGPACSRNSVLISRITPASPT